MLLSPRTLLASLVAVFLGLLAAFCLYSWVYTADKSNPEQANGPAKANLEPAATLPGELANSRNKPNTIQEPINQTATTDAAQKNDGYETALEFYEARRRAMRQWKESRGYHLGEDFAGYDGPENYVGPHPYGYLSEEELNVLAENGDAEAQVIFATYYLQDDPETAREIFEDVVVKTEQTAPLTHLAELMLKRAQTEVHDESDAADNSSAPAVYPTGEKYNDALAYFVYMKDRNDAIADIYLKASGFNSISEEEKQYINNKAAELAEDFNARRRARGFEPFVNSPLDVPAAMNISAQRLAELEKQFAYEDLDPATQDELIINTSYDLKYKLK